MFLFDLFRSFLPIHNPIGFGASDFIEFVLAGVLVALALTWRPFLLPLVARMSRNSTLSMLLLAALPIALRLALISTYPIPVPKVSDDFSYLLLADTFRHFRLANPVHPFHQFFETFFVLQELTYSSIFPPGQGILLALFHSSWIGVAFSIALLSALMFWMLRGFVPPTQAFLGALLAALMFGPLSQWMNSFWGGGLSATAGCLVFGALPRLNFGRRYALLLGLGLAIQLVTRPFEFLFLAGSVCLYLFPFRRQSWRQMAIVAGCLLPAFALLLAQNHAVSGSWTTLPYQVSRYQYGVPAAFTFQPNPVPHRELTREQQLDYQIQSEVHGPGTDNPAAFVNRLFTRVRFYRFFFLAPFYSALVFFLFTLRRARNRWIASTILLFAVGTNFYPYFYPHYVAALTSLLILTATIGLARSGPTISRLIGYLAAFHFVFWYGIHLADVQPVQHLETWVNIDRSNPEGRVEVAHRLLEAPGKQLVFVRYSPRHSFQEWVHNSADIDSQAIVWARDLGPDEDEKLRLYYPDRTSWLLEPDNQPLTLLKYDSGKNSVMEQVP